MPHDIYLPARVSDAPANPPGSRVFSAAMGRALGKFIPNDGEVKFCQGPPPPASSPAASHGPASAAAMAAAPGKAPFESHPNTGAAYVNLFK